MNSCKACRFLAKSHVDRAGGETIFTWDNEARAESRVAARRGRIIRNASARFAIRSSRKSCTAPSSWTSRFHLPIDPEYASPARRHSASSFVQSGRGSCLRIVVIAVIEDRYLQPRSGRSAETLPCGW